MRQNEIENVTQTNDSDVMNISSWDKIMCYIIWYSFATIQLSTAVVNTSCLCPCLTFSILVVFISVFIFQRRKKTHTQQIEKMKKKKITTRVIKMRKKFKTKTIMIKNIFQPKRRITKKKDETALRQEVQNSDFQ